MVLLYDSDCGFCTRALARFGRFLRADVERRALQEFRSADARLQADRLREAITLVLSDGRVYTGAEAIARSVGGAALAYYVPGIRQLADRVYGAIARNRHRLPGGCAASSCRTG